MGTLRDEAYEKLDYLSQITEIVVAPQDVFLNKIPDSIEVTMEMIRNMSAGSWQSSSGVIQLSKNAVLHRFGSDDERRLVSDVEENFEFEVSEDFEVNFDTNQITGSLTLVKKVFQVDEKKLLQLAVNGAIRNFRGGHWQAKRLKERAITVLNTLEEGCGTAWAQKTEGRLSWQAKEAIEAKLKDVIFENKWRVRDAQVIGKIGSWINSYMCDTEDGVGLVNLIKLKIMLDKDLPVYSIDEVKLGNAT